MTPMRYDDVLELARQLAPEDQRRLQAALTALLEQPAEPAEPPAGREPQASVEATLGKIDDNPQIEGT